MVKGSLAQSSGGLALTAHRPGRLDATQVFGLAFGRMGYHGFRSADGVTKFLEKTARVFDRSASTRRTM
jgi:hypothetical protein